MAKKSGHTRVHLIFSASPRLCGKLSRSIRVDRRPVVAVLVGLVGRLVALLQDRPWTSSSRSICTGTPSRPRGGYDPANIN